MASLYTQESRKDNTEKLIHPLNIFYIHPLQILTNCDMEPRLQRFLNEAEISSLVIRERYYRDTGQWSLLRSCYHPDSTRTRVAVGWIDGDIDEFISASNYVFNWGSKALHLLTPVAIHVSGARAVSESTCTIRTRFTESDSDYELVTYARLVSKLERSGNDTWQMLSLETIYEYDSMVPRAPTSLNLQIDTTGRRNSYKYLAWSLERFGFEASGKFPGTDMPETVNCVMDEHFQWLTK